MNLVTFDWRAFLVFATIGLIACYIFTRFRRTKETAKPLSRKRIAQILLFISLLNIAGLISMFFQAEWQLVSPVIPLSTIIQISRPFLLKALIASLASSAAILFYFFDRFLITIIIVAITLLYTQFFY